MEGFIAPKALNSALMLLLMPLTEERTRSRQTFPVSPSYTLRNLIPSPTCSLSILLKCLLKTRIHTSCQILLSAFEKICALLENLRDGYVPGRFPVLHERFENTSDTALHGDKSWEMSSLGFRMCKNLLPKTVKRLITSEKQELINAGPDPLFPWDNRFMIAILCTGYIERIFLVAVAESDLESLMLMIVAVHLSVRENLYHLASGVLQGHRCFDYFFFDIYEW